MFQAKSSQAKKKTDLAQSSQEKNNMDLSFCERKIKWTGKFLEFASHSADS